MSHTMNASVGVLLVLAVAVTGCPDKSNDHGPETAETMGSEATASATTSSSGSEDSGFATTSTTSTGTTAGSTEAGSGGSTTGIEGKCPIHTEKHKFRCSMGVDCEEFVCGQGNWFDEDGCLRTFCMSNDECGAGEICHRRYDCDPEGCHIGYTGCEPCVDDESACCCNAVGGCGYGPSAWGWCIPEEEKPC